MKNDVLKAISERRSVRTYTGEPVSPEEIEAILEAGHWAPSGLNNQPWRFVIVEAQGVKDRIAGLTHYGKIVSRAAALIVVFLDQKACYHAVKDAQAMGACLQNMLLAAHSMGLGAVWLGEILKNADQVREIVEQGPGLDLQAVVAVGRPRSGQEKSNRKDLAELIVGRYPS